MIEDKVCIDVSGKEMSKNYSIQLFAINNGRFCY